jgi:hypothetical protein
MLAHQGGWDEFLFAAAPIALIAGLLALANRRAKRHLVMQSTAEDAAGAVTAEPESD